ncbi:MAG: hypothetical protein JSS36_10525 [Proteobacteria bacterium]|nr:hypothetical protein [Pseudomonadota bacterium]
MFLPFLLLAATPLTVTVTPVPASAPAAAPVDPTHMTGKQIREYNANLQRSDPNYIRCVSQEQIGSLVQSNYVCHTNRQWTEIEEAANKNARDTVDAMSRQSTNGR